MKTSAAGVGLRSSILKQTYPLVLAFLLICHGFVFSSGNGVLAQKRSWSVANGQQRPTKRILRVETPQISNGALIDQEIQANPKAYADTGESAPAPKRATPPTITGAGPNPLAPALGTTFEAINFNEDAATTQSFHIPPDPAGAVGPTHVVNVVNTSIEWYTKAGVRQNRQRLGRNASTHVGSFFESQVPLTNTFDPKVIYDQYANRFVVVTMERIEGTPNQSRVFLAVSDDSDPNGTWHFQTLMTEETIGVNQSWADFPGFAVDSEAVYFTTNMFAHANQPGAGAFTGQRLWIMAKAPWYTGGRPIATRYDPATLANANPLGSDGGSVITTMQPTQMYGDAPGGLGTYLIAYGGINDGANLYVQVIRVDSPLSSPVFTARFSLWGTIAADDNAAMGFPGAPQLGSARTIATNDRRFSQNAVFRSGFLYCAAPTFKPAAAPPDANQVTVHWFKIDPVLIDDQMIDPPPTDQGNIGGEDIAAGTYTFFPSVAVDSAGNMAVGFAASGPNIFPGAYYTGRLAAAPAGTMQPSGGLRAGLDFYIRDFTTSTVVASRWGDYSGIWLDPSDETTFWVFNEYALPRGTILTGLPEEDGRWGNAWGSFSLATPAGATPLGAVLISEFRLRGPNGATDEFIEIYNNTDAAITVADVNPPATAPSGWAIVSADNPEIAKAIIPSGTTIPARGHYLVANSAGYSYGDYPSGHNGLVATTAIPDRTYTQEIPDNRGIALFRTANPASFMLATDRLDAVGPASETEPTSAPYREGRGLPDIASFAIDYSWTRRLPGGCMGTKPGNVNHNCTSAALIASTPPQTSGNVQDTGDNITDFIFVDVFGTETSTANQRLGAPGPENLTSPIVRAAPSGSGTINPSLVFPCMGSALAPNRVRDLTPVTNGTSGTIDIRRKFTNNTGQSLTRLRFRIVDLTTFPALNDTGTANDAADLRALSSGTVTVVNPCLGGNTTVGGTTLEVDNVGPNPGQQAGGAYNSSFSAGTVTLVTPLASGATIDLRFLFGVEQGGKFRAFVIVEALP